MFFFYLSTVAARNRKKTLVLSGDAVQYHYLGIAILKRFGFAETHSERPVYPAFVALVYGIFGIHPLYCIIISNFTEVLLRYI